MFQNNPNSKYINEIDSLRAIAVLGVLFFHLFPNVVTGGFIGVDIFFVISGFVISRSYLFPLLNKEVPIKQFWIKRIRRLMPAYLLIIFFTTIAAYFLLEPNLLKNYGKSLIGQSFYIQNILFWLEGSYFDKAITKPLLHTWSLGVEEQFYIFFILLILFSYSKTKRFVFILSITAVFSFGVGYVVSGVSPKTSFYLFPMRIWEFYLGILAFLLANKWPIRRSSIIWKTLLYILIVITISSFFFSKASYFPGLQSLVACISVFLIISLLIRLKNINNSILSNHLIQYIGKLSYSLYLWHWVLISLWVTGLNKELNLQSSVSIFIVSFIFSYLSYNYIENPIRRRQLMVSTRSFITATVTLSIIVVIVGIFLLKSYGAVYRYDEPYKTWLKTAQMKSPYRCGLIKRIFDFNSEICKINKIEDSDKKGILIIGDSHADQLDEMIAGLGTQYNVPVYLTVRNCRLNQYKIRPYCDSNVFNKVLDEISKSNIDTIIATSFWGRPDLNYNDFNNIVDILFRNNINIVFSKTIPYGEYFNPVIHVEKKMKHKTIFKYPISEYKIQFKILNVIFDKLKKEYNGEIKILDPSKFLCNKGFCQFESEGIPHYIDDDHLSYKGVEVIGPMYESLFKKYYSQH